MHYGPKASQAPLNYVEYKSEYSRRLKTLKVTPEQQWQVAVSTVGQFDNPLYLNERKYRLTASNFGSIIKRKENTSCSNLLKRLLYSKFLNTPAINYDKQYEDVVRKRFEEETGHIVNRAGLFIDLGNSFLAASPNGLIGEDELVEIKCAYSLHTKKLDIDSGIRANKQFYLKYDEGQVIIKTNHNYYYQVQGLFNITQRKSCYFVVYVNDDEPLFIQKIERDEYFWRHSMLPKLKAFYMACFLPEILQNSINQGILCNHRKSLEA